MLQHTLKTSVSTKGIGLHSGKEVSLTLHPAGVDTGVLFARTDLPGYAKAQPASWERVTPSSLCTALGDGEQRIATIEHLMAALAGANIDNVIVEVDGPELPVMDGSAAPFLFLIDSAGIQEQAAPRQHLRVMRKVKVQDEDRSASLSPAPMFAMSYEIDFPDAAIGKQQCTMRMKPSTFRQLIAGARTFVQAKDVEYLQANGLALGGSLDNAVVVENGKVLNPRGFRFPDECVRHKMLDAVGDLYLAGAPIIGHYKGIKAGHALTRLLLEELFSDERNYRFETFEPVPEWRGVEQVQPEVMASA